MIRYREESLKDIKHDMAELLVLHKQEVDGDLFKLNVNWSLYETLEANGMLHLTTVRNDGILVGYCSFVLTNLAHYQEENFANSDAFFLHKEHRKGFTGYKLLKIAIDYIKDRGFKNFGITVKVNQDYPTLMKRLGFQPAELVYTMEV